MESTIDAQMLDGVTSQGRGSRPGAAPTKISKPPQLKPVHTIAETS